MSRRRLFLLSSNYCPLEAQNYLNAIGISNDTTVYYPSTAQEITGAEIWAAVCVFFRDLQNEGLYEKMVAMYPMIGGTAASHKFNAINPLDTNAAFRLSFGSGSAHTGGGMTGSNANPATNFMDFTSANIPSPVATTSFSCSFYSRTDIALSFGVIGWGVLASQRVGFILRRTTGTNRTSGYVFTAGITGNAFSANSLGFHFLGRSNSTNLQFLIRNTYTTPASSVVGNGGSVNNVKLFDEREYAFAHIGSAMTQTQAESLRDIVQTLQMSLKRNV